MTTIAERAQYPECPICARARGFKTHDGRYLSWPEFKAYAEDQLKQIEAAKALSPIGGDK